MVWKKTKWSNNPGCFERHLQRRDGNVLFPLEKRSVTNKAIEEARERDRLEQENYQKKISALASQLQNSKQMTVDQVSPLLQNIQSLIEDAASIGGEALNKIPNLETIEDSLIQQLNSAMPEGKEILEQAKSLSAMERIPYLAQMKRKDTPILETEEVPTLLSEDFATISAVGYISRNFPSFKPSEADIRKHLDEAVRQGFDKGTAQNILKAWNEMK
jgi:hypothetical protein